MTQKKNLLKFSSMVIGELQYSKRHKWNESIKIRGGLMTYTSLRAGTPHISCWGSRSCRPAGREAVHDGTHWLLAAQDLQCTFPKRICWCCSCLVAGLNLGDCPRIAQCSTKPHAGATSTQWAGKKNKSNIYNKIKTFWEKKTAALNNDWCCVIFEVMDYL